MGLSACDVALDSRDHIRIVGSEHQGLRREPILWSPETYGELFDSYRRIWILLRDNLSTLNENGTEEAVKILLMHSRGLTGIESISDLVIQTVAELCTQYGVDKLRVLEACNQVIPYEEKNLPETTLRKWEQLRDQLSADDYQSRMLRYLATEFLEDSFDDDGNLVDQKLAVLEQLARESIEKSEMLLDQLHWITTSRATDGYRFGHILSTIDKETLLLGDLKQAQLNTQSDWSLFFWGATFEA